MINEEIYTDNTDTLRIIEDEYRRGAIDQERYLAIRMAILFKDKNKKKNEKSKQQRTSQIRY